eukprot:6209641-Pleurochrysis_carterae.AAC.2
MRRVHQHLVLSARAVSATPTAVQGHTPSSCARLQRAYPALNMMELQHEHPRALRRGLLP